MPLKWQKNEKFRNPYKDKKTTSVKTEVVLTFN